MAGDISLPLSFTPPLPSFFYFFLNRISFVRVKLLLLPLQFSPESWVKALYKSRYRWMQLFYRELLLSAMGGWSGAQGGTERREAEPPSLCFVFKLFVRFLISACRVCFHLLAWCYKNATEPAGLQSSHVLLHWVFLLYPSLPEVLWLGRLR